MMNKAQLVRLASLLLMAATFTGITVRFAHAQERYAASVRIVYPGVELRVQNTSRWIPVSRGAEMPLGIGDTLRTNGTGRARVTFAQGIETLVLPRTEYTIRQFEQSADETLTLSIEIVGHSIQRVDDPSQIERYTLGAGGENVTLDDLPELFAVQAGLDGRTRVIVGEGTATVSANDETFTLTEGSGLRAGAEIDAPIPLDYPANFAQMDALLDGCPGVVHAYGADGLNIRAGPGLSYGKMGSAVNNGAVAIIAISERGDRYRIRFLSGFGWIIVSAVETSCQNLPVLPYETLESVPGVVNPTADELELLQPFFGLPNEDTWFYR